MLSKEEEVHFQSMAFCSHTTKPAQLLNIFINSSLLLFIVTWRWDLWRESCDIIWHISYPVWLTRCFCLMMHICAWLWFIAFEKPNKEIGKREWLVYQHSTHKIYWFYFCLFADKKSGQFCTGFNDFLFYFLCIFFLLSLYFYYFL